MFPDAIARCRLGLLRPPLARSLRLPPVAAANFIVVRGRSSTRLSLYRYRANLNVTVSIAACNLFAKARARVRRDALGLEMKDVRPRRA